MDSSPRIHAAVLAVAAVLHVGVLGLAAVAPDTNALLRGVDHEVEEKEMVVEIFRDPTLRPAPESAEIDAGAIDVPKVRPPRFLDDRDIVRPEGPPSPSALIDDSDASDTDDADDTAADDDWSLPAGPGRPASEYGDDYDLPPGYGGSPLWSLMPGMPLSDSGAAAPTTAPAAPGLDPQIASKLLAQAQIDKDKQLGLDLPAAGTVASAVQSAVYSSGLPGACRGTVAVSIDGSGLVRAVQVVASDGGSASLWSGVAQAVKSQLAGRAMNMTGRFAAGALITVNVTSKMQLPSGSGTDDESKLALSGQFDLTDVGAKPRRMVTTSFSTAPL